MTLIAYLVLYFLGLIITAVVLKYVWKNDDPDTKLSAAEHDEFLTRCAVMWPIFIVLAFVFFVMWCGSELVKRVLKFFK